MRELLGRKDSPPSRQEILALAGLLEEIIARTEAAEKQEGRRYAALERRLLDIESSRFLRALQWPGRFFADWRGRLGQSLLHSPLHPLYLKLVNPRQATDLYRIWVENELPPDPTKTLDRKPLISVILPVHNPRRDWLEAAVDSVVRQTYGHWQLCVCDDASHEPWVAEYFSARTLADPRIRFVRSTDRLGISGASNRAAELADGEYAAFLDQDDLLAPFALVSIAAAVQDRPADLLYSDHDHLDSQGRRVQPVFKPAFSPDLLRCCMYFGHLLVVRMEKFREAGGFRPAYDGSQDYDLALRLTEGPAVVFHIPRMLYHWRQHSDSTALHAGAKPFTQAAGWKALSAAVHRQNPQAVVEPGALANSYRVHWPVPADLKASLVICSRNAKLLERCLRALERCTSYVNREIVVVQHRTGDIAAMDRVLDVHACLRVPYSGPFNFAAMNNLGARQATGGVLVFLNDDVEPLTPQWLYEMLAHAHRREVGAVGARLLYPSGAIQHAGMAIGIMQGAGHPHRHAFAAQYWSWLTFTRNVSAVTGACLAIRRCVFEQLHGFDEAFPVNYNDVDLCLRARQAGYQVIVEPAAVLRHYECQSRQPGVGLEESGLFEQRWGVYLKSGDPFYSAHLTRTSEDAGLELEDWGSQPMSAREVIVGAASRD
ncbi:MAG: glycosyltransferase [Bryobacteraceae bacterium]